MGFLLNSFIAYNCSLLALKKIYVNIEGQTKNDILKNGLYHITKRENAQKIMEDGHINPSGVINSLGTRRTFFFAGLPTIDLLRENVADLVEQYEWTAINVRPDEKDLENYKIRKYDDNSVTCKGKCELEEGKARMVELCLDLNKEGIPFIREKTLDEIEHGYEPSEELKNKFKVENKALAIPRNLLRAYFVKPFQMISKLFTSLKSNRNDNIIEENTSDNIDNNTQDNIKDSIEEKENNLNTQEEFFKRIRVEKQIMPNDTNKIPDKNDGKISSKEEEIEIE